MTRLMAMTKQDWKIGLGGLIGSLFAGCLNPAYALIIAEILSAYYNTNYSQQKKDVSTYALIYVGLAVASPFIYILQHYSLGILGERLVKRVRERMFGGKHVCCIPLL